MGQVFKNIGVENEQANHLLAFVQGVVQGGVVVRAQVAAEPHQAALKLSRHVDRKIDSMTADSARMNLTNHFLIAMPGLQDEAFARSVIYICEHSERGALGLMINKPTDIDLDALFEKVDLLLGRRDLSKAPVFLGGPVQTERGFVLHERFELPDKDESAYASTLVIPGGLEMTTSKDVLEALATGAGPRRVLVTLGYSSWAEGQLESEVAENSWLTVGASLAIIFDTPVDSRYDSALGLLGLEAWRISPEAGRA